MAKLTRIQYGPKTRSATMTDINTSQVLKLIRSQKTLVLATADPEPWSAPVYYLYQSQRFYFFSSAASRHIMAAVASGRCAGSIFRDADAWRQIEGLQMVGRLERIPAGVEALTVFRAYLKRFPTVKDFFLDSVFDFNQFLNRFRTHLYAFAPEQMLYLNNQGGFGKRVVIQLES